ncbi:hypothetical protein ACVR0P_09180 [Streptococcus castoreus]|nr:hypothetical protein [Streptococcus castoreus]
MEVNTKACIINGKKYKEFRGQLSQLKEIENNQNKNFIFYKIEKR